MTPSSTSELFTALAASPPWRALAACRERLDVNFFADDIESVTRAKAICATCAPRTECLAFALENDMRDGVWGGLSAHQREPLQLRVAA